MTDERKPVAGNMDVRYVANLARLDLTEAEIAVFQPQLDPIVDYFNALKAVDVSGVEPTAHAAGIRNVFREDVERPGLDRETVLANAPDRSPEFFRVPKIVE
jgi:aspartyl-tRNA(Asn)/glutamyl-tRNA(Gln) amidotransferase subunit C